MPHLHNNRKQLFNWLLLICNYFVLYVLCVCVSLSLCLCVCVCEKRWNRPQSHHWVILRNGGSECHIRTTPSMAVNCRQTYQLTHSTLKLISDFMQELIKKRAHENYKTLSLLASMVRAQMNVA